MTVQFLFQLFCWSFLWRSSSSGIRSVAESFWKEFLCLLSKQRQNYSQQKIDNAVLYAKDLKDRYSVLWLNYMFCR